MIITAGIYKGRKITSPSDKISRPTLSKTRMAVFNTLNSLVGDFKDKSFLDMFGGSGIMGLEALSRGFDYVKVFELNKQSANTIKLNYQLLGLNPNLIIGDSIKLYEKETKKYDVIYIDPPYDSNIYERILPMINSGLIVVESSKQIDFSEFNIIKQKKYGLSIISYMTKSIISNF